MNELTLDGKTYVSSKRAAEITGYAKDYIGQMCREGRVEARLVGRSWYVLESSLREHRFGKGGDTETVTPTVEAWEAPLYTPERPEGLSIVEKTSVNVFESVSAAPTQAAPVSRDSFYDLQSAWKDWFEHKAQEHPESVPASATESDAAEAQDEAEPAEESEREYVFEAVQEVEVRRVAPPVRVYEQESEHARVPIDQIQPYPVQREAAPEPIPAEEDRAAAGDRKSTRLNSSHPVLSRMPSSA